MTSSPQVGKHTPDSELEQAREECLRWQRTLNKERCALEDQQYRVRNAEAGLKAAVDKWEGLRDAQIREVQTS